MRALNLGTLEIKRNLRSRMTAAALIAVMLVPLLYGAMYLWAFWDPYGRMHSMPVALVNDDRPVTVDGKTLRAGADLKDKLLASGTFDWKQVDDATASKGVKDGTYYLSLTVPADFSSRLAAANSSTPTQATLQVHTNDANNYLAGQISRVAFSEIRSAAGHSATKSYLDKIYVGFGDIATRTAAAATGAGQLASGASTAASGAKQLAAGTGTAATGATDLAGGAKSAADGASALSAGLNAVNARTKDLPSQTAQLAGGAGQVSSGLGRVDAAFPALTSGGARVAAGSTQLNTGLKSAAAGATALRNASGQLRGGADQVAAGAATVPAMLTEVTDLAGLAQQLAAQVGTCAAGGDANCATIAGSAGYANLVSALRKLSAEAPTAAANAKKLVDGSSDVAAGAKGLQTQLGTLATKLTAGAGKAATLAAGSSQLSAGLGTARTSVSQLATGARQVTAGTEQLAAATPRLSSAISTLDGGASTLATGNSTLASGASSLRSGVVQLSSGAAALATGTGTLATGSSTLAQGLRSGAKDVPSTAGAAGRTTVMADPVGLVNTRLHQINDYGTGFAPYFVPLALWVGALLTFFFIRPVAGRALASNAPSWLVALAGYLPAAVVGIVQALALLVTLHFMLGLSATAPWALFGFFTLTALVFIAVLQLLIQVFTTAGRMAAIILLMLQLTSCAGTFPIETAPKFFHVLHPLLPMTYVVDGLREAISGGDMGVLGQDAGVLVLFGVVAFGLTMLSARRARVWTPARLHPELAI